MKDIKSLFDVFKKFDYILSKKQKIGFVMVFISMIIGAVFETVGVSIVIPFVESLMTPEKLFENEFIRTITKLLGIYTNNQLIVFMSMGVISVYIFKNVYLLLTKYFQIKFECTFQREMSIHMLRKFLNRPYNYFRNINSAMVYRGINGDSQSTYLVMCNIMKFSTEFITVVAIGAFIFYTDWMMALGILMIAALCFICVTKIFQNRNRIYGEKTRDCNTRKDKRVYQTINGIKEIMVMHRKEYFCESCEEAYEEQSRTNTSFLFITNCPEKIIEGVCISGMIAVVCIRMVMGGNATAFVPKLSAFVVAAFRILPSVGKMTSAVSEIVFNTAGMNALYNNLIQIAGQETCQKEYITKHGSDESNRGLLSGGFKDKLEICNIDWQYEDGSQKVLDNLSLAINRCESVALIGQSGAGKSTLADVILGLFKPQSGNVYVDGIDIFTIQDDWCKIVGYVPQTIFIIDDTIMNNVTFGLKEENIDEEKVWSALREARIDDFVRSQPNGINTILGERGVKLSGGQRQRIAIARALYYNPDILVLDEATAALDNETEAAVMESIEDLQGKKTLIIIAHRLTTIKNCDKVYEIQNGKAIEQKKNI